MNKKNNRKGFTIVELVIVIAVIALLATILVPTFGNVLDRAENAALVAEIKNAHAKYVAEYTGTGNYSDTVYIKVNGVFYLVDEGEIDLTNTDEPNKYDTVFCAKCKKVATYETLSNEDDQTTIIKWHCECSSGD